MPKNKSEMQKLRNEIERINREAQSNLSSRKIYSEVSKIMSKPKEAWPSLFVEFYKKTTAQIFEKASHNRTLAYHGGEWAKNYMQDFAQFSMEKAAKDAKIVANICRNIIDPEKAKTFELEPKHHEEFRDWQLAELSARTEYTETIRTLNDWDEEVAKSLIKESQKRLGLDKPLPSYRYSGNVNTINDGNDGIVAGVYCKLHAVREELNKHIFLWRWFHPTLAKGYDAYIKGATELLSKVGFNEKEHGEAALNAAKSTTFLPYSMDPEGVEDECNKEIKAYNARRIPEIRRARDYREWSKEIDLDPETSYESRLRPFAEKYSLTVADLNKNFANWDDLAKGYDKTRETSGFFSASERAFLITLNTLVKNAVDKGQNIDVADILNDARKVAVMAVKFNSFAYETDDFRFADCPAYLKNIDGNAIKDKVSKLLGKSNLPAETKNAISATAADVVDGWRRDPQATLRQDYLYARTHAHPEYKPLTPLEVKIANSLLTIGYRPPSKDNPKMLEKHNKVLNTMFKTWFDDKSKHPDGAKTILAHNAYKLDSMNKHVNQNYAKESTLKEMWEDDEREMMQKFPDYKPRTLGMIEPRYADKKADQTKVSISINLNNDSKKELSPKHEANQNLSKGSVLKSN